MVVLGEAKIYHDIGGIYNKVVFGGNWVPEMKLVILQCYAS